MTKNLERLVVEEYKKKPITLKELREKTGATKRQVTEYIKRAGLETYTREQILYGEEGILGVIHEYTTRNINLTELAKEYGVTGPALSQQFKKYNVEIKRRDELKQNNLKIDYFKQIDTEEKAYFLGLLLTDGNMYIKNDSYRVSLSLQKQDIYMLERLKQAVGGNRKITIDKRDGSGLFAVTNKRYSKNLINLGVVPKKTSISKMPLVRKSLERHLIRGIIDGDGHIGIRANGRTQVALIGTEALMVAIKQILTSGLGVADNKIVTEGNSYTVRWSARQDVKEILHYLYRGSTISLDRKRNIAKEIMKK